MLNKWTLKIYKLFYGFKRIQLNVCLYWWPKLSKTDSLIVLLFHTYQTQIMKYNQQQQRSNVSNMYVMFFVGNPINFNCTIQLMKIIIV